VRLAAAALLCLCCAPSIPRAGCVIDEDCAAGQSCIAGGCREGTVTCPTLAPTFASINQGLFQVGCGARSNVCHSGDGARETGNGLDLAGDAWAGLLGASGQGQFAANIAGRVEGLKRVRPGDPANSFLVIKLKLASKSDPQYGAGMPIDTPGVICHETVEVISQWIAQGASRN